MTGLPTVCTARPGELLPSDPDLALVVRAWAALPKPIRAAVLALVTTAGK